MATRLTAWLLSFCIGLPMCWCCLGEAPREEQAGCCTTEHPEACAAQQPDGSASDRESCPCCEMRKDPRDATKGLNFTPKPESRPVMHLAGWHDSLPVLTTNSADDAEAGCREHGPPGKPPRLYLRHQALLL